MHRVREAFISTIFRARVAAASIFGSPSTCTARMPCQHTREGTKPRTETKKKQQQRVNKKNSTEINKIKEMCFFGWVHEKHGKARPCKAAAALIRQRGRRETNKKKRKTTTSIVNVRGGLVALMLSIRITYLQVEKCQFTKWMRFFFFGYCRWLWIWFWEKGGAILFFLLLLFLHSSLLAHNFF